MLVDHRPRHAPRPLGTVVTAVNVVAVGLALLGGLTACASSAGPAASGDPGRASASAPTLGACHELTPRDTARASSAVAAVACSQPHTAQTFATGTFPGRTFADASYDARALGRYVFRTCGAAFVTFLGSDDSEVERSLLSWAWFRPAEDAWSHGARWYRCDVVGGPDGATAYADLPTQAKNLLGGAPADAWMRCARGRDVDDATVACSRPHDWRAVTTIKLGQPADPYPGDRLVQVRSRDYCSDSVGAWLNYPATDFDYAMTIYHRADWTAGNRRTVCWARTRQ